MTVVPPSLTRTRVTDSLVRMEGIPFTDREKSGVLFSIFRSRIMFPSTVICGVTVRLRAAFWNCTAIVLLATI